ncbi:hypothetical protein MLD38_012509 [Melastoma candidum]|uniref:Uncharacterized protein n=1 Tax=Melastoma candidum TaxID=119954 RepID=A0ACB9R9N9_9MYRT|nr:hypothetical protein MLD38_012509 [Melastoma candidum]
MLAFQFLSSPPPIRWKFRTLSSAPVPTLFLHHRSQLSSPGTLNPPVPAANPLDFDIQPDLRPRSLDNWDIVEAT